MRSSTARRPRRCGRWPRSRRDDHRRSTRCSGSTNGRPSGRTRGDRARRLCRGLRRQGAGPGADQRRHRAAPMASGRQSAVALKALQADPGVARHHRAGRAARLRDLLAAPQAGGGRSDRAVDAGDDFPPGPRHVPSSSRRAAGAVSRDDRPGPHLRRRATRPYRWRTCAIRTACWSTATTGSAISRRSARCWRRLCRPFSFEPFALAVQALASPGEAVAGAWIHRRRTRSQQAPSAQVSA